MPSPFGCGSASEALTCRVRSFPYLFCIAERLFEAIAVIGFRKSQAVVIGIDEYQNGIPALRTAVNDARRIAEVLETSFGYTVQLLTEDVTLEKLRALFGESLPREVEADDRLLVYFAGHGIALDGDDGPAGYLVPAGRAARGPEQLPADDRPDRWLERLPCRHLLLVLDCCFAGAFRWSSTRDLGTLPEVIHRERFDRYIRDPAWQVITSAAYDQKALDVLVRRDDRLARPRLWHGGALAVRRGVPAGPRKARPTSSPRARNGRARRRRGDHGDRAVSLSPRVRRGRGRR